MQIIWEWETTPVLVIMRAFEELGELGHRGKIVLHAMIVQWPLSLFFDSWHFFLLKNQLRWISFMYEYWCCGRRKQLFQQPVQLRELCGKNRWQQVRKESLKVIFLPLTYDTNIWHSFVTVVPVETMESKMTTMVAHRETMEHVVTEQLSSETRGKRIAHATETSSQNITTHSDLCFIVLQLQWPKCMS